MRKGERWGRMKQCLCGNEFYCEPCKEHRKKYCSNACKYKFHTRPSGLKYKIKVVNKGWFSKGIKDPRSYRPPKGTIPPNYKGEKVGYAALHDWVERHKGKPDVCQHCSGTEKVQWANKSWQYKRDLSDWLSLCYWCHRVYDRRGGWGAATKKFQELKR